MSELLDGLDVVAINQLSMNPPGAVLVDVHVDAAGQPTEVDVLQSSGVIDADSLAVRAIKNSRYEPLSWDGDAVAGRFRDVVFPRLGGPANPADQCTYTPPVIKNADFLRRALRMVINGALDTGRPVTRKATALLWVRPDGRVGRAYITGSSCWDEMDSYLVSIWMAVEFEPATCRGEPIGIYTILPFELTGRPR
jgi:TonB family protein